MFYAYVSKYAYDLRIVGNMRGGERKGKKNLLLCNFRVFVMVGGTGIEPVAPTVSG